MFLRLLAGSVAGAAFIDAPDLSAARPSRLGQTDVDQVRGMARVFAGLDHQVGSGLSAQAVVAQLDSSAQLLHGRFGAETTRLRLFSAVADLADVAGGMCFDAGRHTEAERCFRFAVGAAVEAGDWDMRAKALSGLANLAVHQERPDDALSYAEAALVRADRLDPVVRAVTHSRHARALGSAGRHRENDCLAAVDRARGAFTRTGDEPEWVSYYSPAHLDRDLGRAFLNLALEGGDHTAAQAHLTAAVAGFPDTASRGRTLAIANLAHLTMVRDDPRHAAALGHSALDGLGSIRSDRVAEALRRMRRAGARHNDIPAVRELNHRVLSAV